MKLTNLNTHSLRAIASFLKPKNRARLAATSRTLRFLANRALMTPKELEEHTYAFVLDNLVHAYETLPVPAQPATNIPNHVVHAFGDLELVGLRFRRTNKTVGDRVKQSISTTICMYYGDDEVMAFFDTLRPHVRFTRPASMPEPVMRGIKHAGNDLWYLVRTRLKRRLEVPI